MSIPYFERRLSAALRMRVVICDTGARLAHSGLARGYGGFIVDLIIASGAMVTKPNAGTLSPVTIR